MIQASYRTTPATEKTAATWQPTLWRFTVDQYEAMGRAGILGEDDRVELLEGEIVEMTPIGSRHASYVNRINRAVMRSLGDAIFISVQNPVRLGEHSEPQPDLLLLKPRADDYADRHPSPDDVIALVEVADTTLHYDRDVKLPLYARAGVPEVWLVDLQTNSMSVWQDPDNGEYRVVTMLHAGDELTPALLPDVTLKVADLLG